VQVPFAQIWEEAPFLSCQPLGQPNPVQSLTVVVGHGVVVSVVSIVSQQSDMPHPLAPHTVFDGLAFNFVPLGQEKRAQVAGVVVGQGVVVSVVGISLQH
jgi:hypothetical protein